MESRFSNLAFHHQAGVYGACSHLHTLFSSLTLCPVCTGKLSEAVMQLKQQATQCLTAQMQQPDQSKEDGEQL